MIERLIENWLTNTTERGYEIPFCQALMMEGHTIVHLDRHSGTEQGKDIITRDAGGEVCAFQLKTGDVNVREWRNIAPQLTELIEYPVLHHAVEGFARPHLVTTGRLNENVNLRVKQLNDGNSRRGFHRLQIWDGSTLLRKFINAHGRFLPVDPPDLHGFLELCLADGSDLLNKPRHAAFLENMLSPGSLRRSQRARLIASTLILSAYALSP